MSYLFIFSPAYLEKNLISLFTLNSFIVDFPQIKGQQVKYVIFFQSLKIHICSIIKPYIISVFFFSGELITYCTTLLRIYPSLLCNNLACQFSKRLTYTLIFLPVDDMDNSNKENITNKDWSLRKGKYFITLIDTYNSNTC